MKQNMDIRAVCVCMCVSVICMCVCVCVYVCVCMYVCMCVCVYIYIYVYVYDTQVAYGLSKMGVNVYTQVLAREQPGLRVNACSPGFTNTGCPCVTQI